MHRFRVALIALTACAVLAWTPQPEAQTAPVQPLPGGMSAADVAMYLDAINRRLDYVPNQVLVKFKEGTTRGGQQRALMALRARPEVDDLRWAGPIAIVTDQGQPNAHILTEQLRTQPEVEYAQPNYLRRLATTPNDPSYSRQWHLAALDMPRAWQINSGGEDIIVAVIDSGVTNVNGTLSARMWTDSGFRDVAVPFRVNPDLPETRLVDGRDFVVAGRGDAVLDFHGHGTHVSGTVAQETNNGVMLAGMAPRARIMPLKVCFQRWELVFDAARVGQAGYVNFDFDHTCSDAALVEALRYAADNGARVANISLGGAGFRTPAVEDALRYAVGKGVFVAIAAGNGYESGNVVEYPAKYAETLDGAMTVGSVGPSLRRAPYSTTGSFVEIAAPGGDLRNFGENGGVWQSAMYGPDHGNPFVAPRYDRYLEVSQNGTSMAAPHVAGLAALLMSQLGPKATPALVEQVIKRTARPCSEVECTPGVASVPRSHAFGAGLIQPRAALFGGGIRK